MYPEMYHTYLGKVYAYPNLLSHMPIEPSLGRSAPYIQRLRVPSESEVVLVCHGQCGSRTVKNPKTKRSTLSFHIEAETT